MGADLVGAVLTLVPGVAWAKPKPGEKCKQHTPCQDKKEASPLRIHREFIGG